MAALFLCLVRYSIRKAAWATGSGYRSRPQPAVNEVSKKITAGAIGSEDRKGQRLATSLCF